MRLPNGGRIDRSRPLSFNFDGRRYPGFHGDTLASALLANGVHLLGRSFKYHRPRGLLGAGVEEPNALVGVDRGPGRYDPNQRATMVPLHDGLTAESQNRWPSLAWDIGALNGVIAPLIPAGFYYKTFMWPRRAWHALYEPRIRRMAGLGRAPSVEDQDRYAHLYAHCELLIVGAGPAGLATALAAAPSGKRIILCDQDEEPGGALLGTPAEMVEGQPAWTWVDTTVKRLRGYPNVTLLPRTTAFALGIDNLVSLAERHTDHLSPEQASGARERQWQVRAAKVVLATGAIERPIVFPNNDRPGVMLASAAATYLGRYGVLAGRNAVLCTENDSGYDVAFAMAAAGARVAVIADRRDAPPSALVERARALDCEVLVGAVPTNTRGGRRVNKVRIGVRWIACDLVLMAGGWTPSLHLFSQARGQVAWSEEAQAFLPGSVALPVVPIGACRGTSESAGAVADGATAGAGARDLPPVKPVLALSPAVCNGDGAKAFVDFQNDVTARDIRLAVREGFRSVEHIKRYTTNGMATDQGRTSNINALAIAAEQLGRSIPGVGLTTFRAPFTPTTFGTMAGYARDRLFDPVRRTPTHAWAAANGAVFEDVGQWKRARYFPKDGEDMEAAVRRECVATRSAVGIFDASTLGKIEVVGPDAGAFLDLLYVNNFSKLGVGRCRYGVMLREDGFIYDDGVVARMAPDRYHVTTTSGGAANVLHMMEDFRQTEFPHLKLWLTSTTEQWAVIGVNGPHARAAIAPLIEGIEMDGDAFPHMAVREGSIAGAPARIFRVSFTGELGFEINAPASHGQRIWEAIFTAGAGAGITPYGTEAMHVLRAEKGYIIVGQETDGTVTPHDAGLGWAVSKGKPDFVGKRSLARPTMHDPSRKQLVGLLSDDRRTVVEEGAQVVDASHGTRSIGHVTSSYWSDAMGRPIALALLRGGRSRIGSKLEIAMPGAHLSVQVVEPVFYDPEGARLHG